jgi:hypothetical protein
MLQFAEQFHDIEIVSTLSTQLSWSHFIELLPLKSTEARLFYARQAADSHLGVRDLRSLISRKAFERTAIADTQLRPDSPLPPGTFKDPYLFDFLGLGGSGQRYDPNSILEKTFSGTTELCCQGSDLQPCRIEGRCGDSAGVQEDGLWMMRRTVPLIVPLIG